MNWLHYLAEANLYLTVFYLAYCLLFSRETHYQLNRAYLLFSCVAAFALPVVQVGILKPKVAAVQPAAYSMPTNPILEAPLQLQVQAMHQAEQGGHRLEQMGPKPITKSLTRPATPATSLASPQLSMADYLWYTYLTGMAVLLAILVARLASLFLLTRRAAWIKYERYKIVPLPGTNIAFSFFNYLFLGDNAPAADTIITHELVHIRQKHSIDIIFLELLKIVNWFNPVVYLLQNSLKTVHEYIADEHTAANETDPYTYASFLVNTAHGVGGPAITHSFFNYSLLKKRIIMLNQNRSGNSARLKYLVTAPICAALLCASTLAFTKNYNFIDLDPAKAVANVKRLSKEITHRPKAKHEKVLLTPNETTKQIPTVELAAQQSDAVKSESNSTPQTLASDNDMPYKPFVSNGGYYALAHYLRKNIHYSPASDDKGAMVEVGFKLDNEQKISNLTLETSAGSKLDKIVLDAFKNYKGPVNDDAGKYLKFAIYFYTGSYNVMKSKSSTQGDAAGAVLITASPYKFNVTAKGYEYDEILQSRLGLGGTTNSVWIYLKDGSYQYFRQKTSTDTEAALLRDQYGYNYPSNSYTDMEFLPAINGNTDKYSWTVMDVNSYLKEPYTKTFYQHIYDNLQYPENQKANLKTAVVLLKFNLDQSGLIGNVAVAKSGGADFDQAALAAVKSFTDEINDKAGEHTIAIVFCLSINGSRPVVSNSFKTDGYVGELAHAEHKEAFDSMRGTAKNK